MDISGLKNIQLIQLFLVLHLHYKRDSRKNGSQKSQIYCISRKIAARLQLN